jgi:ATP-dependent helicase HrpB
MLLPIDTVLSQLISTLSSHASVVLEAPPGAGKTTRVPLALLEQPWLQGKSILMLEPRRLAARGAAGYMAQCLGEETGRTIGYRVRFENRVSRETRVEVITEGILTRRLQQDPELTGVGLVIFDEFHERNLHSDLALALCLDAQQGLREDLKLLVMSATLDGERIAGLLDAPVVRSEGRSYPVDVRYLPREPDGAIAEVMAASLRRILPDSGGDVLAFLPGAGEIRRVAESIAEAAGEAGIAVHSLYGDLPFAEQEQAILPTTDGRRKLVLSTPIAETSLTIEGIAVVVDSGWQRVPRFDPRSGLSRLETIRVSRAAAEQRAGRAGRLGPGICYRLWCEQTQQGLIPFNAPEISEADLTPLALELAQWGISDATQLSWLDAPPAAAMSQARELLLELEAVDEHGRITALGERMAALPLHPRLSHMLLRAETMGKGALACDVAALLSERDPLRALDSERRCDFALRVEALRAHRDRGNRGAREFGADPRSCSAAERAARQWRHMLKLQADNGSADEFEVGLLLAMAYPDRIARQRQGGGGRYRMANGRGAVLLSECATTKPWLVAASQDGRGAESRIFLAAPVEPEQLEQLFAAQICWQEQVGWDSRSEAVVAREERRLGALVLAERPLQQTEPEAVSMAMLEGIQLMGLESLPWDAASRQLQARVISLRKWFPDEPWPDYSDKALLADIDQWLLPYLGGISRRQQLSQLNLAEILRNRMDWTLQQRLDKATPTTLTVPSGSSKKLNYSSEGAPPILAVKLQEMFGLAETPRVADGRVPVMLHLLSPAQRPLQVTQDLKSFWDNTYPEVKKEMKGRYPKHPWPDDPWNAPATARTNKSQRNKG